MHTGIERESGTTAAVLLTALLYAATHFFASYHIAPEQVTPHSGVELLLGTLQAFAHPGRIADAFLALFAVGVVLGLVRAVDRQHRRLHRAARRLGVGDAGGARAQRCRCAARRSGSCSAASTASSAGWCSAGRRRWPCRCGGSTGAAAAPGAASVELRAPCSRRLRSSSSRPPSPTRCSEPTTTMQFSLRVQQLLDLRQPALVALGHQRPVQRREGLVFARQAASPAAPRHRRARP